MKKTVLTLVVFISCTALQAQKYKKIFYKDQTIEGKEIKVMVEDAVATNSEIKFKLKIKNLTSDYILYKASESSFVIGGKTANPEEKPLVIRPNDTDYRVVNLTGDHKKAENFEFKMDGIYKISATANGTDAPDFQLPRSQNSFTTGPFTVTCLKDKRETARTDVKFAVKYTGDKVAIFEPNKVALKMPDGKEYANYHSDRKPQVLTKEEFEFTVSWKDIPKTSGDMQFANMLIVWRDAFKEITPEKLPVQIINIEFDKDVTEIKNK